MTKKTKKKQQQNNIPIYDAAICGESSQQGTPVGNLLLLVLYPLSLFVRFRLINCALAHSCTTPTINATSVIGFEKFQHHYATKPTNTIQPVNPLNTNNSSSSSGLSRRHEVIYSQVVSLSLVLFGIYWSIYLFDL